LIGEEGTFIEGMEGGVHVDKESSGFGGGGGGGACGMRTKRGKREVNMMLQPLHRWSLLLLL